MNTREDQEAGLPGSSLAREAAVPKVAVILPTFRERENIPHLVRALHAVLQGERWEAIFVDDDSPDGTAEAVRAYAAQDAHIRLLHRVGRRGLASASLEGMLATAAEYLLVMDADLQHDESAIPKMVRMAEEQNLDVVIASRRCPEGSMGSFSDKRIRLSDFGARVSRMVCRCTVSDPMSGFFLVRRSYLLATVHALQGQGFKTLVDILASGPRPVAIGEVGYVFRSRVHGQSKLDAHILVDYLFWVVGKLVGRRIPTRFAIFGLVGSFGVAVHLLSLWFLLRAGHLPFTESQAIATFLAMTVNFYLNNRITYRDRKLRGIHFLQGLLAFFLACSFGAMASVSVARSLLGYAVPWPVAGLGGIVISSVWNYAVNDLFTWNAAERKHG